MNYNRWVAKIVDEVLRKRDATDTVWYQIESVLSASAQPQSLPPEENQAYIMASQTMGGGLVFWSFLPFEGEEHIPVMAYPLLLGLKRDRGEVSAAVHLTLDAIDDQINARHMVKAHHDG